MANNFCRNLSNRYTFNINRSGAKLSYRPCCWFEPINEIDFLDIEAYQKEKQEGLVKLIILKGQGHNFFEGFFKSQEIVDFAISKAKNSSP